MGVYKRFHTSKSGKKIAYWYIRWRHKGRLHIKSVGKIPGATKAMAEAMLADIKKMIRSGKPFPHTIKSPTLKDFSEQYIKFKRDVQRKRSWDRDILSIKHLIDFFGPDTLLSQISPKKIDDYKASRISKVKPATVNREIECLRNMIYQAKKWGQFEGDNPVALAGTLYVEEKKRKILSIEEQEKLIKASPPQLVPLILCSLNSGMRLSEIINLKKDSVDLQNEIITLDSTEQKGKRLTHIPINATLRAILKYNMTNNKSDHVFLNSRGKPYAGSDSITHIFERAVKRAGLMGISFHTLRHTFASRAVKENQNIRSLQLVMRHRDIKTTMKYLHAEESMRDVVNSVEKYSQRYDNEDKDGS